MFLELAPEGVLLHDESEKPPILDEPSCYSECFGPMALSLAPFFVSGSSDISWRDGQSRYVARDMARADRELMMWLFFESIFTHLQENPMPGCAGGDPPMV